MTTAPPAAPMPGSGARPHRGAMILVFGILSWLVCFIFGIVAWVMGKKDLEAMAAGEMDPTGEGLTKAGKIIGMISVILSLVAIPIAIIVMVIGGLAAAGAAASSGAGP